MPQDWSGTQRRNARIIISTGKRMGMSWRDIQTGLMTAMQESNLRNLDYGHADSLGLFQQRPSQGWGTPTQVTNPNYAARKFFSTLRGVEGRNSMQMTEAAQAVQRSAYPDAYAKWADEAGQLLQLNPETMVPAAGAGISEGMPSQTIHTLGTETETTKETFGTVDYSPETGPDTAAPAELGASRHVTAAAGAPGIGADDAPGVQSVTAPGAGATTKPVQAAGDHPGTQPVEVTGQQIHQFPTVESMQMDGLEGSLLNFARRYIGTPYEWGGETPDGFDCSGFVQYVYERFGIELPRVSYQQARAGNRVPMNQMQPGDLVAWDNSSRNDGADHIAIYMGNNRIIEAPSSGKEVRIRELDEDDRNGWGVRVL